MEESRVAGSFLADWAARRWVGEKRTGDWRLAMSRLGVGLCSLAELDNLPSPGA